MRNIVLIGMPGCGKSTLGVLLAKSLMMDFVDTDLLLQKRSGKPLQQMVNELGTAGFSAEEEACVCALDVHGTVIATGGSVALEERAMQHLKRSGMVVFVHLPYETIERRIRNIRTRGIAMEKGQTLRQLYDLRHAAYLRHADVVAQTDGMSVEQAVEMLTQLVSAAK